MSLRQVGVELNGPLCSAVSGVKNSRISVIVIQGESPGRPLGHRLQNVGPCKIGIDRKALFYQAPCFVDQFDLHGPMKGSVGVGRAPVVVIGLPPRWGLPHCPLGFGLAYMSGKDCCDSTGNLVLHLENVVDLAIVVLRPAVRAGLCIDQTAR